jgi:hypothetical protein
MSLSDKFRAMLLNTRRCPDWRSPWRAKLRGTEWQQDGFCSLNRLMTAIPRRSARRQPPRRSYYFWTSRTEPMARIEHCRSSQDQGQPDRRRTDAERLDDGCRAEAAVVRAFLPGIAVSTPTVAKRKPKDAIAA